MFDLDVERVRMRVERVGLVSNLNDGFNHVFILL